MSAIDVVGPDHRVNIDAIGRLHEMLLAALDLGQCMYLPCGTTEVNTVVTVLQHVVARGIQ